MGWLAKQNEPLEQVKADAEESYRKQSKVAKEEKLTMPQEQRPLTYTRPELRHTWKEGDTLP